MAGVYVSSTIADLQPCRARVREALLNRGHHPVSMESYGAEDARPLEKCLQDVASCDVYLGIFAWRYGFIPQDQPLDGRKSITELEFLEAVRLGKSRLLFLLDEEAPWPGSGYERAKLDDVDALRKQVVEDRVVAKFRTEDELYAKVIGAIVDWEKKQGVGPQRAIADWNLYRSSLEREHQWLRLNVIGQQDREIVQIPLVKVFVPQLTEARLPRFDISDQVLKARRQFFAKALGNVEVQPSNQAGEDGEPVAGDSLVDPAASDAAFGTAESVVQVLGRERAQVIVGGPGTGKTTLLLYMMLRAIKSEALESGLPAPEQGAAVPFLVDLRQYLLSGASGFVDYLVKNCAAKYDFQAHVQEVEAVLREGTRALVFFDGLDEVFDPANRRRVVDQFKSFALRYPQAQLIVTTRIAGYEPDELQLAQFTHYALLDFNIQQASDFLHKWYGCYDREDGGRSAAGLTQRITESPRLMELAGNPLLLTIMAVIYKRQDLPDRRWQLYERATSVLLDDWDVRRKQIKREAVLPLPDGMRMGKDQKEKLLQLVSILMLKRGQKGRELNAIAYPQLMQVLSRFLQDDYGLQPGAARDLAGEILNYLRERTFILAEIGEGLYGFVHRTFMEFFAARHIKDQFIEKESDFPYLNDEVFGAHWKKDEWREVLLLLIALLADQKTPVRKVIEHLYRLEGSPPRHKAFAARCLAEVEVKYPDLAELLFTDLADAIADSVGSRSQQAATFVDEALQAFSALARAAYPVPPHIAATVETLKNAESFMGRMAAWQLGFAMQANDTRLPYALEALDDPNESVRRGAIRVLEREWPGRGEVRLALLKRLREDRYGRVKQDALAAIQRGWPKDEIVLDALESQVEQEPAVTYITRVIDYLAASWKGSGRAIELAMSLLGGRLKGTDDGTDFETRQMVEAIARGWSGAPGAFQVLRRCAADPRSATVRLVSLRALTKGWKQDPGTFEQVRHAAGEDRDIRVRAMSAAMLAEFAPEARALDVIRQLVREPVEPVRVAAINALADGWPGTPETFATLAECARTVESAESRVIALRALGRVRADTSFVELLDGLMKSETDQSVRAAMVKVLAETHPNAASLSWLRARAATDADSVVRYVAVACLAGDVEAVGPYNFVASRAMVMGAFDLDLVYTVAEMIIPGMPRSRSLALGFDQFAFGAGRPSPHTSLPGWGGVQFGPRGNVDLAVSLPALLDAAKSDKELIVRAAALMYAANLAPGHPAVLAAVEARQSDETDEETREHLPHFLSFVQQLSAASSGEAGLAV